MTQAECRAFVAGLSLALEAWLWDPPTGHGDCEGCPDCNPNFRLAYIRGKLSTLLVREAQRLGVPEPEPEPWRRLAPRCGGIIEDARGEDTRCDLELGHAGPCELLDQCPTNASLPSGVIPCELTRGHPGPCHGGGVDLTLGEVPPHKRVGEATIRPVRGDADGCPTVLPWNGGTLACERTPGHLGACRAGDVVFPGGCVGCGAHGPGWQENCNCPGGPADPYKRELVRRAPDPPDWTAQPSPCPACEGKVAPGKHCYACGRKG